MRVPVLRHERQEKSPLFFLVLPPTPMNITIEASTHTATPLPVVREQLHLLSDPPTTKRDFDELTELEAYYMGR